MIAFVFPGQGSQKRGMGRILFDEVPEYAAIEKDVDALLGYSMRNLCIEDPHDQLKETRFTQTSLFVVNALHYHRAIRQGLRPSYLAGHSLGEYNALLAAGVFDFMTGLRLVKKRGELMGQARNGGMAAVIGLSASQILALIDGCGLKSSVDVANYNSPTQTVLSGPADEIKGLGPLFEKAGAKLYLPLSVSAAFHSRYMVPAAKSFAEFLGPISFVEPKIPVVANSTANVYPSTTSSESVRALLVDQITHAVQWTKSIQFLLQCGVTEFQEVGPGNVLMRLLHQIRLEG